MKGLTPIINDTVNTETTCFLQTHIDNTLIPTQVYHSHWREERRGERGRRREKGRGEERGRQSRRILRMIHKQDV